MIIDYVKMICLSDFEIFWRMRDLYMYILRILFAIYKYI